VSGVVLGADGKSMTSADQQLEGASAWSDVADGEAKREADIVNLPKPVGGAGGPDYRADAGVAVAQRLLRVASVLACDVHAMTPLRVQASPN